MGGGQLGGTVGGRCRSRGCSRGNRRRGRWQCAPRQRCGRGLADRKARLRATWSATAPGRSAATSSQGRCGCVCSPPVVVGGRGRVRRMHGRLLLLSGRRGRARHLAGGLGGTGVMRRLGPSRGSATQVNGPGLPRVTPPAGQADRMAVRRSMRPARAGTIASAVRCGREGEASVSRPGVAQLYVGGTAVAQSPAACSTAAGPPAHRRSAALPPGSRAVTGGSLLRRSAAARSSVAGPLIVRTPGVCPAPAGPLARRPLPGRAPVNHPAPLHASFPLVLPRRGAVPSAPALGRRTTGLPEV